MANLTVQTLILQAKTALDRQPPLGKSICVVFGPGAVVYIYPDNRVIQLGAPAAADCTISLSLAELADLEQGASITWAVLTGKVDIEGNEDVAKQFGTIVAGAALHTPTVAEAAPTNPTPTKVAATIPSAPTYSKSPTDDDAL